MKYLLDSDTIAAVFDPKSPFFNYTKRQLAQLTKDDALYISILSIYELEFSLHNTDDETITHKIKTLIDKLQQLFEILPLSSQGARYYGALKAEFKQSTGINRKAIKKHNIDMMIAATALDQECILVAKDTIYKNHLIAFNEKLIVEDWTKS